MPPETPRDYEVGYGKLPRHTRFKRSGNPRGRPRESKNLPTLLTEALNERVIVAEDDGRRKITKRDAIITQLVNRSARPICGRSKSCSTSSRISNAGPSRHRQRPPSARRTKRSSS
jgi:hypothetical protein